ncbi:MAG TPA: type II secretion system F family protein [Polyangiaceae bacterium]|nr:type II secretion system F family protein [Polyangiaceae bacterium]
MILAIRIAACASTALSFGALTYVLATVQVPPSPRLGVRGAKRKIAIDASAHFGATEPALRFLAALVGPLQRARLRAGQESQLRRADYPLGLSADEYTALSLLSAGVLGALIGAASYAAGYSPSLALPGAVFGLALPYLQVQEIVRSRFKEITRGLPHAIEIAAMCMGAGLDFPGALRLVSKPRNGKPDALARELSALLEELELGHTRKEALENLAERVPTRAIQDFTHAVIQADQRGNPLSRVLQVQGRMLNMRRSVAAEEAAARAGVLMIAPMVLLLGCIMLVLMGPFVVKGIGW